MDPLSTLDELCAYTDELAKQHQYARWQTTHVTIGAGETYGCFGRRLMRAHRHAHPNEDADYSDSLKQRFLAAVPAASWPSVQAALMADARTQHISAAKLSDIITVVDRVVGEQSEWEHYLPDRFTPTASPVMTLQPQEPEVLSVQERRPKRERAADPGRAKRSPRPPGPCPQCKQEGHWKSECPAKSSDAGRGIPRPPTNSGTPSSSRALRCLYCGQVGHSMFKCNQPCKRCERTIHPGRSCDGERAACLACGQEGHLLSECPKLN